MRRKATASGPEVWLRHNNNPSESRSDVGTATAPVVPKELASERALQDEGEFILEHPRRLRELGKPSERRHR